jgi:alkyl hydroperoxide reductase subunit AhpF
MAILEPDDRELVQKYFAQKLTRPVRLVVFTETSDEADVTAVRTGESSRQTLELVEELAALSDAIQLEVRDVGAMTDEEKTRLTSEWGILGTPTIALGPADSTTSDTAGSPADDGAPPSIRFTGYPGGYEFTSFLETLGSVGAKNWGLTEETVALLGKVDRTIDIKTFVTPT